MSSGRWFGKRENNRVEYAGKKEFVRVFESERMGLERLALLLTANTEAAKRCLVLAFQECIASSSVCKGWVVTWTRRVVIRNAIRLMTGPGGQPLFETISDAEKELIGISTEDWLGPIANCKPILNLPEFDRLVYVICVLERRSIQDCALLLGRSVGYVSEARQWAVNQVEGIVEFGSSLRLAMG